MKKYFAMVQGLAGRFGWGVILSSFTYVNMLLVITAALFCFFLCIVCHMLGIYPGAPTDTSNPIGWVLYLMVLFIYGWFVWSMMASHLLFPLGAAFSTLDLLAARKSDNAELYRGAVAGLCLSVLPIALWFKNGNADAAFMTLAMPILKPHGF